MKKIIWILLLLPFTVYIAGCGTSTENKTGTELVITSLTPMYDGVATNDVDVKRDQCDDGSLEEFKKHTAVLQIANKLLPGTNEEDAGWVEIDYYEVKLEPMDANLPKPDPFVFAASGTLIEPGNSGSIEIDLVPIDVKLQIAQGIPDWGTIYHYNATVTIWGKTEYNEYLTASKTVTLNIGDYDNCK